MVTRVVQFQPERVLFVAQSWPLGVDPDQYFTSIAAALLRSSKLAPAPGNPISVRIAPGTYPDDLTLVSNVHLASFSREAVVISGLVSWMPGAGVNAPQSAGQEIITTSRVSFNHPMTPFTVDGSGKPGVQVSVLFLSELSLASPGLKHISRAGGQDIAFIQSMTPLAGSPTLDFTNSLVRILASFAGSVIKRGSLTETIEFSGTELNSLTVTGGRARLHASQVTGPTSISGAGSSLEARHSSIEDLTVGAGAAASLVNTGHLALTGPGTIDRQVRFSFGPTALGANAVPIPDAPFSNADYTALVEASDPGTPPFVSGKLDTGFTLNDPVGGRTFEIALIRTDQ